MTRLLAFLVHNWPLKIAAVVLSTLLYGILIVSQGSREANVRVPIQPRTPLPEDVALLTPLGDVTSVRYLAPPDVAVGSATFEATADLSAPGVGTGSQTVAVDLESLDARVRVLGFEPNRIPVTLDRIITREVPILVDIGEVPEGLDPRPPELERDTAEVRGAATAVRRVQRVEATVAIEPSGRNIDRDVELVPVDAQGEPVREVNVEPAVMRVQIAVLNDAETRPVPVAPVLTGAPAPGFELADIQVEPLAVTVEGDGDEISQLSNAPTVPISLDGATETFTRTVDLALPTGVLPVDRERVTVTIEIRPLTGTRTFRAGVGLVGQRADLRYEIAASDVAVTLGGSVADLDRLEGRTFEAQLSVAGLAPGTHDVPVSANLPAGLTLISSQPETVSVTIVAPAASVAPASTTPPASSSP